MLRLFKSKTLQMGAAFTTGMMVSGQAFAATGSSRGGNSFGNISQNVLESIQDIPALLSGMAYVFGILLGVLGVLKIKDHVENPSQTPLKEGAIRLAVGGALFALPIVFSAMQNLMGSKSTAMAVDGLEKVQFSIGNATG